jgi:hypothetical protein
MRTNLQKLSTPAASPSRIEDKLIGSPVQPSAGPRCLWSFLPSRDAVALMLAITVGAGLLLYTAGCGPTPNPQALPTDAQASCTVPSATFATWFQSGSVSLNGVVNPANSVSFPNVPNCSFYQWGEQMFMWLNSPAPPTYGGGGGRIFDSPTFFDVSPPAADGSRTFIPHTPGIIRAFSLRAAQAGAHGLPVIIDRGGEMLEVQTPQNGAVPQIRNAAGQLVNVAHARLGADRRPILLGPDGNVIRVQPAPRVQPGREIRGNNALTVQKFVIDGIAIFVDSALNVIDVEQGQADGSVLEAQNGSLIYYATIVNDVYAYFTTGTKDGGITPTPTQFPTTQADLNSITSFASAHGKTFPDPNALAIEIKTSWVETTALANPGSYITMTATIPTYNTSNPALWTATNAQKTTTLALVGMHVVGSTAGHPEMVWATFEHFANAPRGAYTYINTSNQTITVQQSTAATWLFAANNSSGPFNCTHMQFISPNIGAFSPLPPCPSNSTISPSDTIRWKAWAGASDISPNPIDPSTAASNTEVIAINNSVRGMIPSGDLRQNYIMTGATWTIFGASPVPAFASPTPGNPGNQVGTSQLSNATMETYQQGVDNTSANGGSNCFSCHASNTTGVSHVFAALKPLF